MRDSPLVSYGSLGLSNESVNGHIWNPLTRKENNKKSTLDHNLLFNQSNEICKLKLSGIVFLT